MDVSLLHTVHIQNLQFLTRLQLVNHEHVKVKKNYFFLLSSAPPCPVLLANTGHASIPASQIEGRPESGREVAIISSLANKGMGSGAHFNDDNN
jgi:hypothetical protein